MIFSDRVAGHLFLLGHLQVAATLHATIFRQLYQPRLVLNGKSIKLCCPSDWQHMQVVVTTLKDDAFNKFVQKKWFNFGKSPDPTIQYEGRLRYRLHNNFHKLVLFGSDTGVYTNIRLGTKAGYRLHRFVKSFFQNRHKQRLIIQVNHIILLSEFGVKIGYVESVPGASQWSILKFTTCSGVFQDPLIIYVHN